MAIQVGSPQIQVLLLKTTGVNFGNGGANQYRGASGSIDSIDLTPFLGDIGGIHTHKSVEAPCGGFSLTFADKVSSAGADTVYALAEAQDIIEIRMARIPVGTAATPPLVMRGYISTIRRVEEIRGDGTPYRVVVIQGQDGGKLWQIHSILPEAQLATNLNSMLSSYTLLAVTGILAGLSPVADFVRKFNDQVMTPAINHMSEFAGRAVPTFTPKISVPSDQGWISASTLQGFSGGRYWDVLEYVADRPWNELFVRDQENGPELIFRPVPYRDIAGALIMPGAEDPGHVQLDIGEIVKLDTSRGDSRMANFFWVPPGSSQPDTGLMASVAAFSRLGGANEFPLFSTTHDNSALALYGLRKMEHGTRLLPPDLPEGVAANLHRPTTKLGAGDTTTSWHLRRAGQLNLLNRDNVVFETTEMVTKGREDLIAGIEIQWTRGQYRDTGLLTRGYCTAVQHVFTPLRSGSASAWTTTLTIERADGFLTRDELSASPYWLEGRRGPYSPTS